MTSRVNKSERTNMKVSKTQVKENRDKIVEKATQLFRSKGYDGVGIAELMSSAGFTHGGFYKHFSSKTDLVTITAKYGLEQVLKKNRRFKLNPIYSNVCVSYTSGQP